MAKLTDEERHNARLGIILLVLIFAFGIELGAILF